MLSTKTDLYTYLWNQNEIRLTNKYHRHPFHFLVVENWRENRKGKEKGELFERGEQDGKEVAEGVESEYPSCRGNKQAAARI